MGLGVKMGVEGGRVNVEPRISLNKLGEYLTATPGRRRKILFDQKYPSDFIVTRYNDAEAAIIEYIFSNTNDVGLLDNALEQIEGKRVETDWEVQTKALNMEALEAFYDIADQIDYTKYSVEKCVKSEAAYGMLGGVQISVRPEIVIYRDKGEEKVIGATKIYFSKSFPLLDGAGEYVSSFLVEYLKQTRKDRSVNNRICNVIDVFSRNIITAPISYKRRMADIEAACQEIAAVWNRL